MKEKRKRRVRDYTYAILSLILAIRLHRGKLTRWVYEVWASVSLSFGFLFLLLLLPTLPIISLYLLDYLGLLHFLVTLSCLVSGVAVFRLTTLISSRS